MDELRGIWRGKRIDEKKWWADGYLICPEAAGKVAYIGYLAATDNHGIIIAPVDPSTLGECTGLRDKNGNPIFEGDIVKIDKATIKRFEGRYGVVKWLNDDASFALVFEQQWLFWNDHIFEENCEIIGNIHDNPELLKGEANENV